MKNVILNTNSVCPLSTDGLEVVCCEDCIFHSGTDDNGAILCSNPYIAQINSQ